MNKLRFNLFHFFFAGMLFSNFISCSGTNNPAGTETPIVFPDKNISYSQSIQPLFDRTCALSNCHDDITQASNLSLTSYNNATARPGIIIPGDPDHSILVERIDGRLSPRMPLYRDTLNANQIHGIRQWILEGARNN
ncbi:MAG: c-type cytochrome domain-containing protein [Bacteroidota bacterium]